MSEKLTKAQRELLFELAEREQSLSDSYKPLLRLEELGLVTTSTGKFGGCTATITDRGLCAAHAISLKDD